jgi:hypothetical protein
LDYTPGPPATRPQKPGFKAPVRLALLLFYIDEGEVDKGGGAKETDDGGPEN